MENNQIKSNEEIDQIWRKSTVEPRPEHHHIQRLFAEPYADPSIKELFAEGARIDCLCGHRMETYREWEDHTESSREYYRSMQRTRHETPDPTRFTAMWNAMMQAIESHPDHEKLVERMWANLPAQTAVAKGETVMER